MYSRRNTHRKWPNMTKDTRRANKDILKPTISKTRVFSAISSFSWAQKWNWRNICLMTWRTMAMMKEKEIVHTHLAFAVVQFVHQLSHFRAYTHRIVGPANRAACARRWTSLPLSLVAASSKGKFWNRIRVRLLMRLKLLIQRFNRTCINSNADTFPIIGTFLQSVSLFRIFK